MTLLLGRINTCRRPRFSALDIVLRQSARTDMRTIYFIVVVVVALQKMNGWNETGTGWLGKGW
jgi:hypothetical protein